MQSPRDPIAREARESRDLYGVATWEQRSALDTLSVWIYSLVLKSLRALVVLVALVILATLTLLCGLGAVFDPMVSTLVALSVIPALAIALYVWYADITTGEPLSLLVVTFLLAVLFATFAAVVNSALMPAFELIPILGLPLFFYLVVGPVEEFVKILAVRLYAYRTDRFDAVIDGAVYGAVAGLGFATIENAFYITQALEGAVAGAEVIGVAGDTAAARALAGPGHVLFSAIAGFYLGLAKFNREHAGPIVAKGILIAAFLHATYNTLVSVVPPLLVVTVAWMTPLVALVGFIIVYDGLVAYYLYRKLSAYRRVYREVGVPEKAEDDLSVEATEFDP